MFKEECMFRKAHFKRDGLTGDYLPRYRRNFFSAMKKKELVDYAPERPGALPPDVVRRRIDEIGVGKLVEIRRIGFDGTADEHPIVVEIQGIYKDGFSGKVTNFERGVIHRSDDGVTYGKTGGGVIRFNYLDGDIKDLNPAKKPQKKSSSERNISGMKDILTELGIEERIVVKYYDRRHRGTVNVEGVLVSKSMTNTIFKMIIDKINNIELESKFSQQFDIEKELVVDISTL